MISYNHSTKAMCSKIAKSLKVKINHLFILLRIYI